MLQKKKMKKSFNWRRKQYELCRQNIRKVLGRVSVTCSIASRPSWLIPLTGFFNEWQKWNKTKQNFWVWRGNSRKVLMFKKCIYCSVCTCLSACICMWVQVLSDLWDSPELNYQEVVSCLGVGSGKWTQVLCKQSMSS